MPDAEGYPINLDEGLHLYSSQRSHLGVVFTSVCVSEIVTNPPLYTCSKCEWLAFPSGEDPMQNSSVCQPQSPDDISPVRPEEQSLTIASLSAAEVCRI